MTRYEITAHNDKNDIVYEDIWDDAMKVRIREWELRKSGYMVKVTKNVYFIPVAK